MLMCVRVVLVLFVVCICFVYASCMSLCWCCVVFGFVWFRVWLVVGIVRGLFVGAAFFVVVWLGLRVFLCW